MRLNEFIEKHPSEMSKEELEIYMVNIIHSMNAKLDVIDERYNEEHRTRNTETAQQNSSSI